MHFSAVKPLCSTFRMITAKFSGVRIFTVHPLQRQCNRAISTSYRQAAGKINKTGTPLGLYKCCIYSKIWIMWFDQQDMCPKSAAQVPNSADHDHFRNSLTWVHTVCSYYLSQHLGSLGSHYDWKVHCILYDPCHNKTCLWGFRPGKIQTGLLSYRD